jgi:hypothetical protein
MPPPPIICESDRNVITFQYEWGAGKAVSSGMDSKCGGDRRPRRTIRDFRIVAAWPSHLPRCCPSVRVRNFLAGTGSSASSNPVHYHGHDNYHGHGSYLVRASGRALSTRAADRRQASSTPSGRITLSYVPASTSVRAMLLIASWRPESRIASALAVILAAISSKCQGRKS